MTGETPGRNESAAYNSILGVFDQAALSYSDIKIDTDPEGFEVIEGKQANGQRILLVRPGPQLELATSSTLQAVIEIPVYRVVDGAIKVMEEPFTRHYGFNQAEGKPPVSNLQLKAGEPYFVPIGYGEEVDVSTIIEFSDFTSQEA